jgi:hypothetical protein
MLLQTVPTAGVFDSLIQYGVLGIATLGLGWACWKLLQRQLETEERLNTKVDELEKKFDSYVDNDHTKLKGLVDSNIKAYLELRDMIVVSNTKK